MPSLIAILTYAFEPVWHLIAGVQRRKRIDRSEEAQSMKYFAGGKAEDIRLKR